MSSYWHQVQPRYVAAHDVHARGPYGGYTQHERAHYANAAGDWVPGPAHPLHPANQAEVLRQAILQRLAQAAAHVHAGGVRTPTDVGGQLAGLAGSYDPGLIIPAMPHEAPGAAMPYGGPPDMPVAVGHPYPNPGGAPTDVGHPLTGGGPQYPIPGAATQSALWQAIMQRLAQATARHPAAPARQFIPQ